VRRQEESNLVVTTWHEQDSNGNSQSATMPSSNLIFLCLELRYELPYRSNVG